MEIKKCPRCNSKNLILSGKGKAEDKQRFNCKDCNYHFTRKILIEPVPLKKADEIYSDYLKSNFSNYKIAKIHGLKSTELQRWFTTKFWKNRISSKNKFKKVAYHSELTADISSYLKSFHPIIRVKPQFSNVVIQYLHDGHKTDPRFTFSIFTLFEFRELYGETFCTVKFHFLNNRKNRSEISSLPLRLADFLPDFYQNEIHIQEESKILRNIKVSDFLDDILSDEKTLGYIDQFKLQKDREIERRIKNREILELKHKALIKEKALNAKRNRNKV